MLTDSEVRQCLSQVKYPGFSRDIVSFGLVKQIGIEGGRVRVLLSLATRDPSIPQQIHASVHAALTALPGVEDVRIDFDLKDPPNAPQAGQVAQAQSSIPGVKKILAVASGKGGVGKSTVSSNLAIALAKTGLKVGLCDCDLYGPSIAHMFGSTERPGATDDNEIIPVERYGVKIISMGLLIDERSPVIVRGPMATRYTQQFLRQVAWGDLDVLVLDLPPGTGDIQLTIVQTVAIDGAVIVSTPQEVALIDARKAVSMFEKVNVPILGLVENMSWFECPSDGKRYYLFGEGGGAREAKTLEVPLLAEIPIDVPTREGGDEGRPVTLTLPEENKVSLTFHALAKKIRESLDGA